MYFVRYDPLKEKLRDKSLSDREALPYLVVYFALLSLFGVLPAIGEFNEFDMVSGALSVIFAIGGILYSYEQNGGKQGFDLLQKLVILGWVVLFRFFLVFLSVIIVVVIIVAVLEIEEISETSETGGFDVVVIALLELIFYQRLGRHIRDTRNSAYEQETWGRGNQLPH